MFRLKCFLFFIMVVALPFVLTGCFGTTFGYSYYDYYDKCSAQTSSFVAMVECGKQARNASCGNDCSSEGTAFVQYADALAMAVKNHEMTEAEAMRRYAEYKTGLIQADNRDNAIRDAGRAAAGPNPIPRTDAPALRPMPIPCPPYSRAC